MYICEISIIIIMICQKLGSLGLVQQKIKLPLPYICYINIFFIRCILLSKEILLIAKITSQNAKNALQFFEKCLPVVG